MPEDTAISIRDLRGQVAELSDLGGEVVFQHIRTGHESVTIYSVLDGEPIPIPRHLLPSVAGKKLPDGRYMFTDNPNDVPVYRLGEVKCFLHAESEERKSGILAELGLAGKFCVAGHLASLHSKRIHGEKRHKQENIALQEYLKQQKEAIVEKRAQQQLDATLTLAGKATAPHDRSRKGLQTCQSCGNPIEGALADHQCS